MERTKLLKDDQYFCEHCFHHADGHVGGFDECMQCSCVSFIPITRCELCGKISHEDCGCNMQDAQ